MAKKYLLYIHDERFEKEQKKSELINKLLAEHYGPGFAEQIHNIAKAQKKFDKPTPATKKPKESPLDIPGVERASEAKCKGEHYMSRKNCGKQECPWSFIK